VEETVADRGSALRPGNIRQPRPLAGLMSSLAAIGDDIDRLEIQNGAGRFGANCCISSCARLRRRGKCRHANGVCGVGLAVTLCVFQQAHVDDLVGYRQLDDQLVLGIDGDRAAVLANWVLARPDRLENGLSFAPLIAVSGFVVNGRSRSLTELSMSRPSGSQGEVSLVGTSVGGGSALRHSGRFPCRAAICALALASLPGCAGLASSGPSASDVAEQATVEDVPQYEVVDIDASVIEALKRRSFDRFSSRFGDRYPAREPVLGVGDTVTVTIWEAGPGGLFTAPLVSNAVSTGSNSAAIPPQVVGRDGGISVPYAGRVHVAGKTTRAVQDEVQKALEGKAIQPQVLVNVTLPVSNSVSVVGEVASGARVPLSVRGDRVLDVIAAAGGVRAPVNETFVELSRGSSTLRVPLEQIVSYPRENIYVHPNDVLTLVRDPQTFISYGAVASNSLIPFQADGITLAQALSKVGGLNDDRSDSNGVFVLRYEIPAVAQALRPSSPLVGPGRLTPIAYRLNLTNPNSLFLEQNFQIANHDLIYVSNAPSTRIQKIFGIVSGSFAPLGAAAGVATAVPHF
jgi:polysaccharide biosynthesis/export protein